MSVIQGSVAVPARRRGKLAGCGAGGWESSHGRTGPESGGSLIRRGT